MRRKSDVGITYLCAVKFWRAAGEKVHTLRSGVRYAVRVQGFSADEIRKAETKLKRDGLIEVDRPQSRTGAGVRLTPAGASRAKCSTVALRPWTDPGNPGASLSGAGWTKKDERKYKSIFKSCTKTRKGVKTCKRIAAATVNRDRKKR